MESGPPPDLFFVFGGCLTVIAGSLAVLNGISGVSIGNSFPFAVDGPLNQLTLCGIGALLAGVVAVIGGLFAIRGKHFSFALGSAVLGIVAGGWMGFYVGLAAVVLLMLSNQDL